MQQVERELLVRVDVEAFDVDLREDVERGLRLDGGDAGDLVEHVVDEVALVVHAAARHDVVVDALVAAERGLHHGLGGHVRTHAHVGEHVEALDVVLGNALVAGQDHPADAVAGDHVRFRQAGEGHAEQVRGHRGDGDVLQAVHDEAIVDFVGEDDELVFARDVDDLLEHFLWVKCAGGVVRVDDDNRLGVAGDLGADVVDVRIPFGLFVAQVVHGGAAG